MQRSRPDAKKPHLERQFITAPDAAGKLGFGFLLRMGRKVKALLGQAKDEARGIMPGGPILGQFRKSTWGSDRGRQKRHRIARRRCHNAMASRARQLSRRTGSGMSFSR